MKTAIREGEVKRQEKRNIPGEHPVKVTAYLWIIDAISEERYEDAPEMIAVAMAFGARRWDIHEILSRGVERLRVNNLERIRGNENTY